jgi:quercetin dioxygenase-like cupin family protein
MEFQIPLAILNTNIVEMEKDTEQAAHPPTSLKRVRKRIKYKGPLENRAQVRDLFPLWSGTVNLNNVVQMSAIRESNGGEQSPVGKTNDGSSLTYLNPLADNAELAKAKPMITVEIIEYVENAVVIKTILKKSSGNISVMSVDTGEGLTERTTPFDTFVQVIDGKVELVISGKEHLLNTGSSIIMPAHSLYYVRPDGRFKMILTIIKSAYE